MKKLLLTLTLMLFPFSTLAVVKPEITDHEKVTVYMFRGKKCGACYIALSEIIKHLPEYNDYMNFETYEVWYSEENSKFYDDVINRYEEQADSIPYFVAGDSFHQMGYTVGDYNLLIDAVLNEYQNANYKDPLSEYKSKYNVEVTSLKDACVLENIPLHTRKNYMAIIVIPIAIIISLILIIKTLVSLNYKKKKKTKKASNID